MQRQSRQTAKWLWSPLCRPQPLSNGIHSDCTRNKTCQARRQHSWNPSEMSCAIWNTPMTSSWYVHPVYVGETRNQKRTSRTPSSAIKVQHVSAILDCACKGVDSGTLEHSRVHQASNSSTRVVHDSLWPSSLEATTLSIQKYWSMFSPTINDRPRESTSCGFKNVS